MSKRLEEMVEKSVYVLREVMSRFNNPCILFSGGKDSTLLLYLAKQAFYDTIPCDVVHIDTSFKFTEIYEFRDKLAKEWDFNLVVAKNDKEIKRGMNRSKGRDVCCHTLKTEALRDIIEKEGYDAVIVGIRRDEHGIRNKEHFFSPRDKEFRWNYAKERKGGDSGLESTQDSEFEGWDIFSTEFEGADHMRVHPILHWDEIDVWEYIKREDIPVNPLYFSKNGIRYRSLGCVPCTNHSYSDADTIDKIIREVKSIKAGERDGRDQDKEEIMEKLRLLGYM